MKSLERFAEGEARRKKLEPDTLSIVTEQLYLYAGRSLRFLMAVVVLLAILVFDSVPGSILFFWTVPILLLILYRLHELKRYQAERKGRKPSKNETRKWYWRFRSKAVATAILTGLSVPLFHPYLSEIYLRFLLFFFIIGISAGALSALFPDERPVTTYVTLVNLPLFLHLLLGSEPYSLTIAMVQILFVIVLLMIAQISRRFMFKVWKQQKKLRAKERELHALFEQTPAPIFYFDTDLRIRKYNQAFQRFFKIPSSVNLDNFDLRKLRHYPAVQLMEKVLWTHEPAEYDGRYISTFNPDEYWILAKVAPLFNEEGNLIGGIVSFQDKTMEKRSIDHLEQLASHDILTGLGNRRSFFHTLNRLVTEEEDDSKLSLLFFVDLDQFKPINDTLGHNTGDRVLREVADILRRMTPEKAHAFRHGGDEFVVLFPHCCRRKTEARERGERFVGELNRALESEIVIDGYRLPIRSSVGIVIITPEMKDPDEIIRRADISMYQAKDSRENLAFYDPTMDHARQKSFHLRQSLNRRELDGQLRLDFQPIVSLEGERLQGAEALIRWEHPSLGLLQPGEFIPLAVESGAIGKIGRWVSREVCETLRKIRDTLPESSLRYLSFNLDARELNYEDFPGYLESLIREHRIQPGELILELTENSLIDNFPRIRETVNRLHHLGVLRAIDDFGIGYSSLSYLERLSFDILKIDSSIFHPLAERGKSVNLTELLLRIARDLDYSVIVEGVEDEAQIRHLRGIFPSLQCQGYYYSEPLSRKEFFRLLENPNRLRKLKSD
jgi:diguanylate cyclase (GGDEF)-like protein